MLKNSEKEKIFSRQGSNRHKGFYILMVDL